MRRIFLFCPLKPALILVLFLAVLSGGYTTALRAGTKVSSSSITKEELRALQRRATGRSVCERCRRPTRTCICDCLPAEPIDTITHVLVLQHPRECRRRKSVSTVPLLSMFLRNFKVKVGSSFDSGDLPMIQDAISTKGQTPLLLFPGDGALSLDSRKPSIIPSNNQTKQTLVLVDGTWTQSAGIILIRKSPWLRQQCQLVQFTETAASNYGTIRREPRANCLSTLEACTRALTCMEAHNPNVTQASHYLHQSLAKLISTQLQYSQSTTNCQSTDTFS